MTKDYKNWPKDLPLLVVHGTGDLVRSIVVARSLILMKPSRSPTAKRAGSLSRRSPGLRLSRRSRVSLSHLWDQ